MTLEGLLAAVMLAALVAYALLGGADFGGGIWDLLSRGPRAADQRRAVARAIGPVWEANHVWLIFLIVLLFTCFPFAYAWVSVDLFWPLHLVLVGIVLRGAAFVFRAYGSPASMAQRAWGRIFGASSAITPFLLGWSLGAVSVGRAETAFDPFNVLTGVLALLLCAYLAAVYLAWETDGPLQDDFRRRALLTWFAAGVASLLLLGVAGMTAGRLWDELTTPPASLLVLAGVLLAPASAFALWRRRFHLARVLGGAQVTVLLLGWAVAQWPYLVYPAYTITEAAAPRATLLAAAVTLPFGLGVLIPSLWFLFAVFKRGPDDRGEAERQVSL